MKSAEPQNLIGKFGGELIRKQKYELVAEHLGKEWLCQAGEML